MLQVCLETTNRCNLKCLHCVRDKSFVQSDLDLNLFQKIIKEVKVFGITRIALTGGEPTLHPRFADIIKIMHREKIAFSMVTNGWNFQKIYPILLDNTSLLPQQIIFSLDGAKRGTHDKIRGAGSFDRVIQAMVICRKKKIPFAMQMVITSSNISEMEDMCFLASGLKGSGLQFAYPFPTLGFIQNNLMISPDEYKDIAKKTRKLKSCFRIPIQSSANEAPFRGAVFGSDYLFECCILTGHFINIDCRGDLTFCCNLSTYAGTKKNRKDVIGSLKEERLETLYKKFLKKLHDFHRTRVNNTTQKKTYDMDKSGFACLYCLRHFDKLNWSKNLPRNNPWRKYIAMKNDSK